MGGRSFTAQEKDEIQRLKASGMNPTDIARTIGRSRSAVDRYVTGDMYSDGKTCGDCSARLSNITTSGYCRSCIRARFNKVPEMAAKRAEGRRRSMSDPLKYARACALARSNIRKAMANPETRARFVEDGKRKAAKYYPALLASVRDPEQRKAAGRRISEARLAWCPPEYRDTYRHLVNSKNCTAAEGRALITAQIAADKERELNALSPFERQMKALENGGKIVANINRPAPGNQVITDPTLRRAG